MMLAMQVLQQIFWQIGTLLYSPVFWLAVAIVFLQVRQRARLKQELFQLRREPLGRLVLETVAAGLCGGLLASVLLLLLGVTVDDIGLEYLWMIALLLLLVRQRFLCFAYSGGVLAACNCLWGWPALDGAQLLATVAVLHCTEAFLVLTTGHKNALPLYLQTETKQKNEAQQVTGGFLLQMVWPLPMVMLLGLSGAASLPQAGFMLLPDWWPLLGVGLQKPSMTILYMLLPVLAALGYSDLAVTHSVRAKTRQSALLLLLYSGTLLLLVFLTQRSPRGLLLPALFAPLGHEAVIWYGKRNELRGASRFLAPARGVLVLDVQHGSPAARAGLRSEDWIIQLDGQPVENRQQFLRWQYGLPAVTQVGYVRRGRRRQCRLKMGRWSQPGIITAPDGQCNIYWNLGADEGLAKLIYKKLAKTLKKT